MRGHHHCEKDIGTKVAAFRQHLESTNPNQDNPNLSPENEELLTKFATFLQQQKHKKHMDSHDHHKDGHCHGKHSHMHGRFGKHGHRGMFGHHFGKHGPYGKHGHHGHGRHGHHHGYHGHGKHGKHSFEYENPFEHGHFCKHDKTGKHLQWNHDVRREVSPGHMVVAQASECVEIGHNPSLPAQGNTTVDQVAEGPSELDTARCVCERKGRHHGRRWRAHEWAEAPKPTEAQGSSQAESNEPPQDNLVTLVDNITIANSPETE